LGSAEILRTRKTFFQIRSDGAQPAQRSHCMEEQRAG
jgi:hypothetical protein